MADKTCGTCLCGQQPSVWCSCSDQIKPANQLACDDYRERSDSVEQVALDMMGYFGFCAEQFIVPFGGKIDEFANRMDALGVKR